MSGWSERQRRRRVGLGVVGWGWVSPRYPRPVWVFMGGRVPTSHLHASFLESVHSRVGCERSNRNTATFISLLATTSALQRQKSQVFCAAGAIFITHHSHFVTRNWAVLVEFLWGHWGCDAFIALTGQSLLLRHSLITGVALMHRTCSTQVFDRGSNPAV